MILFLTTPSFNYCQLICVYINFMFKFSVGSIFSARQKQTNTKCCNTSDMSVYVFFYNVGRYRRGKCLAHRERLAQRDLVCHMNVGWETD